jgi:hypothetical protein
MARFKRSFLHPSTSSSTANHPPTNPTASTLPSSQTLSAAGTPGSSQPLVVRQHFLLHVPQVGDNLLNMSSALSPHLTSLSSPPTHKSEIGTSTYFCCLPHLCIHPARPLRITLLSNSYVPRSLRDIEGRWRYKVNGRRPYLLRAYDNNGDTLCTRRGRKGERGDPSQDRTKRIVESGDVTITLPP